MYLCLWCFTVDRDLYKNIVENSFLKFRRLNVDLDHLHEYILYIIDQLCRQNRVRLKGAVLKPTGAEMNPLLYEKLEGNKSINKPCVASEMLN